MLDSLEFGELMKNLLFSFAIIFTVGVSASGAHDGIQEVRDEVYESFIQDNGQIKGHLNRIFQKHEYDSLKFYPSFFDLKNAPLPRAKEVRGKMVYGGRFIRKYAYDVLIENAEAIIEIRIFFRNASDFDKREFSKKLQSSAKLWSDNIKSDLVSFPVRFRFLVTNDPAQAHFNVKTVSTSFLTPVHGPYDTRWSRNWGLQIMSHEIGHMLGLNDEYHYASLLTGGLFRGCDKVSIMCSPKGGVQVNHSYFILRRLLNHKDL